MYLKESKANSVVLAFGRFSPPTNGHELLVKKVVALAQKQRADHIIYASKTQDKKKNPLNVNQKVAYLKHSFPGVNIVGANDKVRTFIEAVKSLDGKYDNLYMIAGSDRILEYKNILDKYNGKEYNFKSIVVVSAGERDPDADNASGMSATKMRQAASSGDFNSFKRGVPTKMSVSMAKKMYDDVRAGMGITEQTDETREAYVNGEIFNVGDIVLYEDKELTIQYRGSNYVILEGTVRAWLKDITATDKVNESMAYTQKEKLKVAQIIAMTLGYEDVEGKTNPTMIINLALRQARNKVVNREAKKILAKMLAAAKEAGINFDEKLAPQGLKEEKEDCPKKQMKKNIIDANTDSGEAVDDEEKEDADLMVDPDEEEDVRRKKIMYQRNEEVEEDEEELSDDELGDMVDDLTDDEIIEHGYDDEDFNVVDDEEDEPLEEDYDFSELNEVLSKAERMKARVRMARSKSKRQRALKIALKKRSDTATLGRRARRTAIAVLKKKYAKKPVNQLTVSEKERLEKRIKRMSKAVSRLSMKMMPKMRQIEKTRLSHRSTK